MVSFTRIVGCARVLFFVFFFLSFSAASAASPNVSAVVSTEVVPDVLLKSVTEEVLSVIKQNPALQGGESGDQGKLALLIEEKVAPHFDFAHMTRLAMGSHWRKATEEERELLVQEFRVLLLHTYSGMLLWREDNTITFKPLRTKAGDTDVLVRLVLNQPGTEALTIDINMEKTSVGWKAYNVTVGGVSLVTTYRSSFASQIEKSGVAGLVKALAEKNRQRKKQ